MHRAAFLLERIAATGTLRVVTRTSPTTYYTDEAGPRGIDYELARGFAERLGVALEIQVADRFAELIPDVARAAPISPRPA